MKDHSTSDNVVATDKNTNIEHEKQGEAILHTESINQDKSTMNAEQRSHNLRKFPQIYAVFMGVVLVIMRILCILFKSLLLSHSQPPSPYRNKDMEISCESGDAESTNECGEYVNPLRDTFHNYKYNSEISVV